MLLDTGTEEIAHIEMLATAVALNLEGASMDLKEDIAKSNSLVGAVMGGMDPRHILSSGLGALAVDANGVPFNGSWVIGTGNLAADMTANVMAESTGRLLATRLYEMTDDPGMKDMLSFLIARDTMHQNQWLAVLEELGHGTVAGAFPIPNSFPQAQENQEVNYTFFVTNIDENSPSKAQGRWTQGTSVDNKGQFRGQPAQAFGPEPKLGPPEPLTHAQVEEMQNPGNASPDSLIDKVKGALS
jgi:Mn-containing catalase